MANLVKCNYLSRPKNGLPYFDVRFDNTPMLNELIDSIVVNFDTKIVEYHLVKPDYNNKMYAPIFGSVGAKSIKEFTEFVKNYMSDSLIVCDREGTIFAKLEMDLEFESLSETTDRFIIKAKFIGTHG